MKKLIFATGNQGKLKEIREIMADLDVEVLSMKEAGVQTEIEENGTTFEENAVIKARDVGKLTGELTLADDSGLEIDYLNKEPGVYSARYMGEDTSYHVKNASLVKRLEGVPMEQRTARFVCVIAAVFPDGRVETARGTIEAVSYTHLDVYKRQILFCGSLYGSGREESPEKAESFSVGGRKRN